MAFGGFERHSGPSQPMSEINVTPLVDVMLVLLVIFIITAPLLSYAIKLDLPNDPAPAAEAALNTIKVSIDADGKVHVDTEAITDDQLRARFSAAAKTSPVPEVFTECRLKVVTPRRCLSFPPGELSCPAGG